MKNGNGFDAVSEWKKLAGPAAAPRMVPPDMTPEAAATLVLAGRIEELRLAILGAGEKPIAGTGK